MLGFYRSCGVTMPIHQTALGMQFLPTLYSTIVADNGVSTRRGVHYGPHERHALDLYEPASGDRTGPVALFIYGGSWRRGDRGVYGFVGAALAARGITSVIPDYRLFPEVGFPTFIEDAALAYAWTIANVAQGANGRRPVFLSGHSAGGYTAANLAFNVRFRSVGEATLDAPAGFVGLAGPYAFDLTTYAPTRDVFDGARSDEVRPVDFVSQGAPPSLLLHGLKDKTVETRNTRELKEALTSVGTPVRTIEFERIGHTGLILAVSRPFRQCAPVLDEMVTFMSGAGRTRAAALPGGGPHS